MPNRPDLHLSCSLTSDGESYSVVEDQPEEQWLTNPRNLKQALIVSNNLIGYQTTAYWQSYTIPPLPDYENHPTNIRYGSWSYDSITLIDDVFGKDSDWSQRPIAAPEVPNFWEHNQDVGRIDEFTGQITGPSFPGDYEQIIDPYNPGDYGNDIMYIGGYVVTGPITGYIDVRQICGERSSEDFPDGYNFEPSYRTWRLQWSLKEPRTMQEINERFTNQIALFCSNALGFSQIPDGEQRQVRFSDLNNFEFEPLSDHGIGVNTNQEIEESDRYLAHRKIISSVSQNLSYEAYIIAWVIWCAPLGGYTIWTSDTSKATHLVEGDPRGSVFLAANIENLRVFRRGSYDNPGLNSGEYFPAHGSGVCFASPEFHHETDFSLSNVLLGGVNGTFSGSVETFKWVRFFEDMPYVGNVQTAWYIQNEVHIHGLWLPPINVYSGVLPDFWINESSNIELVHIPTGELFDKTRFMLCDAYRKIARGPDDRYERVGPELGNVVKNNVHKGDTYADLISITGVLQNPYKRKLPGGWYHLKITSDLGYWDSREYPDKYPNGLFNMQDPFGT